MATLLLRQGGRRIGGSVLQRTQAAAVTSPVVADEQRRLVPRRMLSTGERASTNCRSELEQVRQKKEELYEVLSNSEVDDWPNRRLLQHLAVNVYPRQHDTQWRRLRASRWANNVVSVVAHASFSIGAGLSISSLIDKLKSYV